MKTQKPGGRRQGAGRPAGTGKFGEPTRTLRIPEGAVPKVVSYLNDYRFARVIAEIPSEPAAIEPPEMDLGEVTIPVSAGSPMPSDDDVEFGCDLNRMMVRRPEKTRIYTVTGDSMDLAGIAAGDKLVVDWGLEARHGDIVIAIVLGEGHTVKRFSTRGARPQLIPESSNPIHKVRELTDTDEWMIWAVVTGALKKFR